VIQLTFGLMVVAGLFAILWRTYREAAFPGRIVLAGAVVHGVAAMALFGISWFNLPILASYHSGDGFWNLAPDARYYYRAAAPGATQGLDAIASSVVSPLFVRALAIWMSLAGVHQAAPLLLNFAVYVVTCALIVHVARTDAPRVPDRAIAMPLVAISASPLLLLCGAQILKDMVFACALALTLLGIRAVLRGFREDTTSRASASRWVVAVRAIAPRMLWFGIGVYVLAGIRPYYGIFVCGALGIVLAAFIVLTPRWRNIRVAALSAVVLFVGWVGLVQGADTYYPYYRDAAKSTLDAITGRVFSPLLAVTSPVRAPNWNLEDPVVTANALTMREGFLILRGDTTIGRLSGEPATASRWTRVREAIQATAVGLAAMVVPVSLLKAAHIVDIPGGRGLLLVTDLDTLCLDASAIAAVWLLIRERRALTHDRAYLCVCLVMFVLVTPMLAYVVTNLGMLVRLRVIAFLPLWMATLAISRAWPVPSVPPAPGLTAAPRGAPEARSA
jgi:hypothetical protein